MISRLLHILLSLLTFPWTIADHRRRKRRAEVAARPFPDDMLRAIKRNVPIYASLPEELREQLLRHVRIFLAEKRFEGCNGLEITDEMRATIAAQACLLLLNRETGYFPKLRAILVYPGVFLVEMVQHMGPVGLVGKRALSGESWPSDYVVLSWDDVKKGGADHDDGNNLVLHEFAHQLDLEDGDADGTPLLEKRADYAEWARVFDAEYKRFSATGKADSRNVIDPYGAENPTEFFAVVTEAFFERPARLKEHHPKLYGQLVEFYKVNPAEWG
jgi:MtfA peptidase